MNPVQRLYWKAIGLLVLVMGYGLVAAGLILGGWSCILILNTKAVVNWNGERTADLGPKLVISFGALIALLLGILIVKFRSKAKTEGQ